MESLEATIGQALLLSPDRIALFGYAHVPWFKKHQTMIDEAALPGPQARLAQRQLASALIEEAGYQPIGFDHFAKPGDTLAAAARAGRLRRNFQGYTDDGCETLIGLGPSSVSRFRQGYAQNASAINVYSRRVERGGLATARGIALSEEDRARAWVIERLMCDFAFSRADAESRFGAVGRRIIEEAQALVAEEENLLTRSGDLFQIPAGARVLVRAVASRFDQYLARGNARHSVAV
jgi:oxygen-independent coproporphyrinogen-3 oxidase